MHVPPPKTRIRIYKQMLLKKAGCEKIFTDKVSGTVSERPGLTSLKEQLRRGDTLVVYRLDRLARSIKDLIDWVTYLETICRI